MAEPIKEGAPLQGWSVAECAVAYESSGGDSLPDLREFAERSAPADRGAALIELVKIDMERRWRLGQPKRVEQYLSDYPELSQPEPLIEELVAEECLHRIRRGAAPSAEELRGRFPSLDTAKVLPQGQNLLATMSIFGALTDTRPMPSSSLPASSLPANSLPDSRDTSGTIRYDLPNSADAGESRAGPDALCPTVDRSAGSTVSPASGKNPTSVGQPPARSPPVAAAPAVSWRPDARLPAAIGRYTVRQQLGSGSFGVVYRCFDEELKREVAIKMPHRQGPSSGERLKEFLHEARSAARLRHPGIVAVLDTSQTSDGQVYIVYEFIPGTTLQSQLDAGDYSLADVIRWTAGTADALQHAHRNGIVHRDIKPANILLDEDGDPHVADFGLAKMDDHFFKNDAGRVLGTAAYMSPEQAAGQSHWATPQTDVYSLGVMLYQLLARRLPFMANTLGEMIEQVRHRIPPPPRTIDDHIPKPLEDICLRAMAKNPADRYSTALDMAADLRIALASRPPPLLRGPLLATGVAGAAVATLLCLLAMRPWNRDRGYPAPGETPRPTIERKGAGEPGEKVTPGEKKKGREPDIMKDSHPL